MTLKKFPATATHPLDGIWLETIEIQSIQTNYFGQVRITLKNGVCFFWAGDQVKDVLNVLGLE